MKMVEYDFYTRGDNIHFSRECWDCGGELVEENTSWLAWMYRGLGLRHYVCKECGKTHHEEKL